MSDFGLSADLIATVQKVMDGDNETQEIGGVRVQQVDERATRSDYGAKRGSRNKHKRAAQKRWGKLSGASPALRRALKKGELPHGLFEGDEEQLDEIFTGMPAIYSAMQIGNGDRQQRPRYKKKSAEEKEAEAASRQAWKAKEAFDKLKPREAQPARDVVYGHKIGLFGKKTPLTRRVPGNRKREDMQFEGFDMRAALNARRENRAHRQEREDQKYKDHLSGGVSSAVKSLKRRTASAAGTHEPMAPREERPKKKKVWGSHLDEGFFRVAMSAAERKRRDNIKTRAPKEHELKNWPRWAVPGKLTLNGHYIPHPPGHKHYQPLTKADLDAHVAAGGKRNVQFREEVELDEKYFTPPIFKPRHKGLMGKGSSDSRMKGWQKVNKSLGDAGISAAAHALTMGAAGGFSASVLGGPAAGSAGFATGAALGATHSLMKTVKGVRQGMRVSNYAKNRKTGKHFKGGNLRKGTYYEEVKDENKHPYDAGQKLPDPKKQRSSYMSSRLGPPINKRRPDPSKNIDEAGMVSSDPKKRKKIWLKLHNKQLKNHDDLTYQYNGERWRGGGEAWNNKYFPSVKKATDKLYAIRDKVKKAGGKYASDWVHMKEDNLGESLPLNANAGDWIHDFVHSKNPKFKGKSKKQRIKMALGAYYARNRQNVSESELEAEASQLDEISSNKLKSYIVKASLAAADHADRGGMRSQHSGEYNYNKMHSNYNKANKRLGGVAKAVSKLKEEDEQVDESFVAPAAGLVALLAYRALENAKNRNKRAVIRAPRRKVNRIAQKITKHKQMTDGASAKRALKMLQNGHPKVQFEEAGQLDELSIKKYIALARAKKLLATAAAKAGDHANYEKWKKQSSDALARVHSGAA